MERPPKISVIIVTYNQEDTIARAIESVLRQTTTFPFEIVIGDDCSSDGTFTICQEYTSKYPEKIRLFRNETNMGVQANYFDSLLRCRGEYIADCAGDDFWIDPLKLQKEADLLDSNQDISLVHTGWCYYDEDTKLTSPSDPHGRKKPYLAPINAKGALLLPIVQHKAAPIIHLCTSLYRKKLLLSYYDSDIQLFRNKEYGCEDLQISACMAHAGAIAYIPDITLCYSIGKPSIMSVENPLKTYRFYKGTITLINQLCRKFDIDPGLLHSCYAERINHLYAHAFTLQDRDLIAETKALAKQYRIPLSVKSHIKELITHNRWLWDRITKSKKP